MFVWLADSVGSSGRICVAEIIPFILPKDGSKINCNSCREIVSPSSFPVIFISFKKFVLRGTHAFPLESVLALLSFFSGFLLVPFSFVILVSYW